MRSSSYSSGGTGSGSRPGSADRGGGLGAFPARSSPARQQLEDLLGAAPTQEESGLNPDTYRQLMIEVRQHTEACLANPRVTHTNLINALVEKELAAHQERLGLTGWHLRELNDQLRNGNNRLFIFGQVVEGDKPSLFVGRWRMERASQEMPIYFQVTAEPEILAIDRSEKPDAGELRAIRERGEQPWKVQVPRNSAAGAWLMKLYGCSTSGFIDGQYRLGVFAEAVQRECSKAGLSHMLLPRARRDPGKEPWHVGSFLTYNGDFFLWNDWALDRSGAPVRVTVKVQPRCTILRADTGAVQSARNS